MAAEVQDERGENAYGAQMEGGLAWGWRGILRSIVELAAILDVDGKEGRQLSTTPLMAMIVVTLN